MIFTQTSLSGVWEIRPEMIIDERGSFARISCNQEFRDHGLIAEWSQCSISCNKLKGTLRGMHFQKAPYGEHKLVRCTMGRIFDVALDLRESSPTRYKWHAIELSANNHVSLYIPPGIAHGFITLENNTEVLYQMHEPYVPDSASGVRWDDPSFNIKWPLQPLCISQRDSSYPFFDEVCHD